MVHSASKQQIAPFAQQGWDEEQYAQWNYPHTEREIVYALLAWDS